mmetsp:Transcript_17976/g.20409  ORF Transcript_17976/g.20409 Transcript_17976/m.20409 type:complete len:952 (+) Transcript_17976:4057-6912(+)|eukprot:CAMPEP_0114996738 /NCGR_PEP_ID=MMETSP0216-20121206/14495_1 /TAXON_ID=223996 /ORGANISM="Protocruzia adherens, Strain Boccale" /LENGTH=951 /DNA_ID=CAMNT_0002361011 /DNA_START=4036 /DNA_END=6891 /DNA_ORIENTATION=-
MGEVNPRSEASTASPKEDKHAEFKNRILEESEPSKFSHLLVHWPCLIFGAAITVGMICMIITFATIELVEDGNRSYLVWSDIRIQREDAYKLALEEYEDVNNAGRQLELQSEEVSTWLVWIVYEQKKGNLFTPEAISEINRLEGGFPEIKNYSRVCFRRLQQDGSRECQISPSSAVEFFPSGSTQTQINTSLENIFNDTTTYNRVRTLFDKDLTRENKSSKWLRTSVRFGAPIIDDDGKRYNYYLDDEEPQDDFMEDFSLDAADYVQDFDSEWVKTYYYNQLWFQKKFDELVLEDFGFIIISICFVLLYMMVHTRSLVIPLVGMFNIILAFPMAYVLYRFVFQVSFFNMMSLLSVFVILGISADNMFVYMDTWKQAAEHDLLMNNLERQTIWTYRKAAHAMLVTTLTTFCAFMATAVSELMPIAAFGIFAACFILFNYVLVITSFPAVVVLREKFFIWRRKGKPQESHAKKTVVLSKIDDPEANNQEVAEEAAVGRSLERSPSVLRAMEMSKQDRFFYTTYSHNLKKARYIVIGLFLVWFILTIVLTTQISPPSEQEQWVDEDHELRETTEKMDENFSKNEDDGAQIIHVVWGVDGVDTDAIDDRWDPEDTGEIEWDSKFDMSAPAAQQSMWQFCQDLKKVTDNDIVRDGLVTCFLDTFKTYVEGKGEVFPVPQANFITELRNYMEESTDAEDEVVNKRIGLMGDRLRYVSFKVIGGDLESASDMFPRYDDWQDLISNFKKGAPEGVGDPFQTSQFWLWMVTERALVQNALVGIAIASAITFVVLVFSTLNILLATYAIFCIIGIILSVMGVMFFNGWDFGTAESVAVVILIGFSVDYVVHLCHAYIESHNTDRFGRTRDALAKMGFSILGGAVTTFGDGCVLFFCTIIFFFKFAWIITSTIFFALLWALLFLAAVMMTFGPQNDTGDLKVYYKKFMAWYQARKEIKKGTV